MSNTTAGTVHDRNETDKNQGDENDTKAEDTLEVDQGERKKLAKSPDGGWGYMVLLGAVIVGMNSGGMARIQSVVYQQLFHRFNKTASETAWVTAINGYFKFAASPLASIGCNRFGARITIFLGGMMVCLGLIASAFPFSLYYIYITYGVIAGIGGSFIGTSCTIMVGQYFDKKRAKANAIMAMGAAFGGATISPLLTVLYEDFGYSNTLILQAALFLHVFISAALMRPLKRIHTSTIELKVINDKDKGAALKLSVEDKIHERDDVNKQLLKIKNEDDKVPEDNARLKHTRKNLCTKYLDFRLLKKKTFLSYTVMMFCSFLSRSSSGTFFAALASERGISNKQLAVVFIVAACVDFISRLLIGILFDLQIVKRHRILGFCIFGIMFSVLVSILPLTQTFGRFLFVYILRSVASSALLAQHSTILCDIVGRERLSSAVGLARFFIGLGYLSGPAIGGVIRDTTGQYGNTFYFAGGASAVGILVLMSVNFNLITSFYGSSDISNNKTIKPKIAAV